MSMHSQSSFAFLAVIAVLTASPAAHAQHQGHDHSQAEKAPALEISGDPYLLNIDPVTGDKLGPLEGQVVITHEGCELRFNSEKSLGAFRSDPAKVQAKVDEAIARQQLPFYPLETCPVSGGELGGMGKPVNFVYRNRLVRFCCKGCKPRFLKDPSSHLAKLDESVIAAQRPKYPLSTCVVSGEALGGEMGEPVEYVVGNRLVRLCCAGCQKKVAKDPLLYLAKLDAGKAPVKRGEQGHRHDSGDGGDHHHN